MKLIIGVIATLIVLFPPLLAGQTIMTNYTATSIPSGPPTDWGTIKCPGGEVLQWPPVTLPPCSEGTKRLIARGMVQEYSMIATDPRMTGREVVTGNGNMDGWTPFGPGSGQVWGIVTIYVTDGGVETGEVWDGTWRGTRTVTETTAISVLRVEVHGSGGRIEGLSAHYDVVINFVEQTLVINGVIIEPGGARRSPQR